MVNKQIMNHMNSMFSIGPFSSRGFWRNPQTMFVCRVVYFTLFFLRLRTTPLRQYSPMCIIEEDFFWKVYNKHFDEVKKLKIIVLGSDNNSSDVKKFSNYFLQAMSKNEIFFADFKVRYRYIKRAGPLHDLKHMDSAFYNTKLQAKYFSGRSTYWKTVKNYSADTQYVVIIIVWNVEDLRQALISDAEFLVKHRRSLYSILFVSSELHECPLWRRKIGDFLYELWTHYKMFNVIAQAPCSCDKDKIFILKPFYPINETFWGALDVFPMATDDVTLHRMMNFMRSLHHHPLKVSIFDRLPTATKNLSTFMLQNFLYQNLGHSGGYSGVDGAILENFAKFMHFNLTIVGCDADSECYGSVYPNGTITTSLGLVASGQVELSANGRFLKRYNTSNIEFTSITYSDQVCFVVRKAAIVPSWMFLYRAFDCPSWICIFFTFESGFFFWFLQKILSILIYRKKVYFNMRIIKQLIHTPTSPSLKKSQALFTTIYLIYSVIFTGIFQAVMFKIFSLVTRYNDVDTLQTLLDENYEILSSLDVFSDDNTEMTRKLNRMVSKAYYSKALRNVATSNRKYTTLERKRDAEYLIDTLYTTAEDEPLLHIVKECPVSYFMAYIVPLNSPYRKRFDYLISTFREAGLIEYWYTLMVENLVLQEKLLQNRGRREKTRSFTLKDVEFPFILLNLGCILSVLVFFAEVIFKKRKKRTHISRKQLT